MHKLLLIVLALLLVSGLVVTSCSSTTTNPAPSPATSSQASPAPAPAPQATSALPEVSPTPYSAPSSTQSGQAQYGGVMRIIVGDGPIVFGNPRLWKGGMSYFETIGCGECLTSFDEKGNLIPMLATSWDLDPTNNTMTFHLRQGVKFQDGTDFNADAVKWNFDERLAGKQISGGDRVKSVESIDKYTVRLNFTQVGALDLITFTHAWPILSPTAIQQNGEEWSLTHIVGTGPFEFVDFKRDTSLTFKRFDGWWGGKAYLDGLQYTFIKDPVTASAMIQAGQADIWVETPTPQDAAQLKSYGFQVVSRNAMFYVLAPDSGNPGSPFAQKEVREAIEYAIDRPTLAKSIGLGYAEPLNQLSPSNSLPYNPDYAGRAYDPEKAKQLLADAGYAKGFQTSIYCQDYQQTRTLATAVQGYLAGVGIDARVDVCDAGRYSSYFAGNWKDGLLLRGQGINAGMSFVQRSLVASFSDLTLPNTLKSPEYKDSYAQILAAPDLNSALDISKQLVIEAADYAMLVPLMTWPNEYIAQPYVHTTFLTVHHRVWDIGHDWMSK
jgi:peptide/nickel transport system substrate-binding protein